jgi:hypothetical protein
MDTIEIVISSPDHGITWNAWLGDEQILTGVHTPVFDACRVLLERGVDPKTKVASRHAGQPYRSLTTTVGYGAKMTVAVGSKKLPYPQDMHSGDVELDSHQTV